MSNPLVPLTPTQTLTAEEQASQEEYVHRVLVGVDQFFNVLTDGDPDETISARSARASEKGKKWGIVMSKFLDVFQKNHGVKAQAGDLERAQAVVVAENLSGGVNKGE